MDRIILENQMAPHVNQVLEADRKLLDFTLIPENVGKNNES